MGPVSSKRGLSVHTKAKVCALMRDVKPEHAKKVQAIRTKDNGLSTVHIQVYCVATS